MSASHTGIVLLVRHCNTCGHEWVRHRGCTSWHGFHSCEACASQDVQTVKECTESQWGAAAALLMRGQQLVAQTTATHTPRRLVCRECRHFLPARTQAEIASSVPELCESCQPGKHAPTTCLETAYGVTVRHSFQIKVF
jgi:hypothetical protein